MCHKYFPHNEMIERPILAIYHRARLPSYCSTYYFLVSHFSTGQLNEPVSPMFITYKYCSEMEILMWYASPANPTPLDFTASYAYSLTFSLPVATTSAFHLHPSLSGIFLHSIFPLKKKKQKTNYVLASLKFIIWMPSW